jgi:hypothetical protein
VVVKGLISLATAHFALNAAELILTPKEVLITLQSMMHI